MLRSTINTKEHASTPRRSRLRFSFPKRRHYANRSPRKVSLIERIQSWCLKCRDPGVSEAALKGDIVLPSEEQQMDFRNFSPFDPAFSLMVKDARWYVPAIQTASVEFEVFSPFDERFPNGVTAKRCRSHRSLNSMKRPKMNSRARRLRRLAKRLRAFAYEPVLKRRNAKKAMRGVPKGLKFPSLSSPESFTSVSPFDSSFPFGLLARRRTHVKTRAHRPLPMEFRSVSPFDDRFPGLLREAGKLVFAKVLHSKHISLTRPVTLSASVPVKIFCTLDEEVVTTIIPFPALTPIAKMIRDRDGASLFFSIPRPTSPYGGTFQTVDPQSGIVRQ